MRFRNTTELDSRRLEDLFVRHSWPYRHDKLAVTVRYSRGADFSGRCFYRDHRVFINLGRHVRFPYLLGTHVARSKSNRTHWWREIYTLRLDDAYQLALFIYLHEFFHFLVKAARRCTRRKESMCDRFATRVLVDGFGCLLRDRSGGAVERAEWDFQDLERFVARAPRQGARQKSAARKVIGRPAGAEAPVEGGTANDGQLLLGFG